MKPEEKKLLELMANTLRMLGLDQVQKANSGHPGIALSAAEIMAVLAKHVNIHPDYHEWINRDRFVMSAGHGSTLLYAWLLLEGFLKKDDPRGFRQLGSRTPGHPEYGVTPGVETSTGPLGQGIANAVGMALAEEMMANRFNQKEYPIIDHHTYVLCGDGDMMEGVSYEACSLAGHLGLKKLIVLYDSNETTIEGSTRLSFTEDVRARFESQGWRVQEVKDGHNPEEIDKAITIAKYSLQPNLIICKTIIGKNSPLAGDCKVHGAPLSEEDFKKAKEMMCWKHPDFFVPEEVKNFFQEINTEVWKKIIDWDDLMALYSNFFPKEAEKLEKALSGEIPEELEKKVLAYEPIDPTKSMATREHSGEIIQIIAEYLPGFIGGSADLAPSNLTQIKKGSTVGIHGFGGSNIPFGVREHAMGAIMNGVMLYGGFRPFCGTFLVFSDYMRPAIRMAAMMKLPVIYVLTHDSFFVGEDGPTHQPVEHLASLRVIPNLTIIRPADVKETAQAWLQALKNKTGTTVISLSRQKLPPIDHGEFPVELEKGAYITCRSLGRSLAGDDVLIWATGSEVSLAIKVANKLSDNNIGSMVISAPSLELFDQQREDYRNRLLGTQSLKVVIEAGSSQGWHKYAGQDALIISLDQFGKSAKDKHLAEKFGFTPDAIVAKILERLQRTVHNF